MDPFSDLPREVFDMIFTRDHLAFNDIKEFSQCSKACRYQILPTLFRGIQLNRKSVRAMKGGKFLSTVGHFVRSIRKICIDSQDFVENTAIIIEHNKYLDTLTDEEKKLLDHGIQNSDLPKFLQESFDIDEIYLSMNNLSLDNPARFANPSFGDVLLNTNADTLKKLELSLGSMSDYRGMRTPDTGTPIFPSVTYLSIKLHRIDDYYFQEIVYRFPNVEELMAWPVVRNDCSMQSRVAYSGIIHMEKLRRVFLLRQYGPESKRMTRKELQTSVEYWIGLGRDSDPKVPRLTFLESVEFSVDDPDMSIGCRVLRKTQPSDKTCERFRPLTTPREEGDSEFKDLEFDWQTMGGPFWDRIGPDPQLLRRAGGPLSRLECELDRYSWRIEECP
ncbi:hypothetical protein TWF718_003164 [Orbilia javanica]|uniref:Uncharacterized protein n=1 Tax=Orbilia javanica TaxID=47235 RepID=A0AAN8MLV6_9PEZI